MKLNACISLVFLIMTVLFSGCEKDGDNDGFGEEDDCNDSNASIYPGSEEIWFDNIDQDCDGYDFTITELSDGRYEGASYYNDSTQKYSKIVFVDASGELANWNDQLRQDYKPNSIDELELIGVLKPLSSKTYCYTEDYSGGHKVKVYAQKVNVVIYEAKTGRRLSSFDLYGITGAPMVISTDVTEYISDYPELEWCDDFLYYFCVDKTIPSSSDIDDLMCGYCWCNMDACW